MNFERIDPVVRYFWEGRSVVPWHEPLRRIYDCELVYVSEGGFVLIAGELKWQLTAGMLAIVPPAKWHESKLGRSRCAVRHCIHFDWNRDFAGVRAPLMSFADEKFDAKLVHTPPGDIAVRLPLVINSARSGTLLPVLRLALEAFRRRSPEGDALLWPVLKLMLEAGTGSRTRRGVRGKTEKAVLTMKHHIETHFGEELGSRELSALTRLSGGHLCQAFSRVIGCPPTAYLNRVRLQHARRLLRETTLNVAEVASAVGIRDANYFARLFRKYSGVSPTEYIASAVGT